jgi:hypothetical protein
MRSLRLKKIGFHLVKQWIAIAPNVTLYDLFHYIIFERNDGSVITRKQNGGGVRIAPREHDEVIKMQPARLENCDSILFRDYGMIL